VCRSLPGFGNRCRKKDWPRPTSEELIEADRLLSKENLARNESVPWPLVERILADSVRSSRPKVYSAPRRFDLSTIMVVTAAYALMFSVINALFSSIGGAAGISIMVGLFVTLVGVGQAFMYGGRKPRTASILVGVTLTCLIMFGSMLFFDSGRGVGFMLPWMLIYGVLTGAIYGYLAGVMVGGVFLASDLLRRRFKRNSLAAEMELQTAASPFDAS
jgi:hypothetical protein